MQEQQTVTYTQQAAEGIARELGISRMSCISLETDLKLATMEMQRLNIENADLLKKNSELIKENSELLSANNTK